MKKTFLAFAFLGCGAVAFAQEDSLDYNTMNTRTTLQTSTSNYNAYSTATTVPWSTQTFLIRDYPEATNPTWEQSGNWYRATLLNNNRNVMVYYSPNGSSYSVALPVIQSWVPEEIVTTALSKYGNNIYAINKIRGANGQELFQVTLLEAGQSRTEYLSADGNSVAAVDVFVLPGMHMLNSSSTNAAKDDMNLNHENDVMVEDAATDKNIKTKTKIKYKNGHEIKTKTKNGKTTVKESDDAPDMF